MYQGVAKSIDSSTELFLLLLKMTMKQGNTVSWSFLLPRMFPVVKFIISCLQCSRRLSWHDPMCLVCAFPGRLEDLPW